MAVRPHEKPPRTALTNTPDLSRLFGATSIALVGASERSNWARTVLENLQGCGFEGAIHLVHPREERQFDLPCYASLAEVPGPVDVVYLLTGAATFASILAECGEKGVPWAVALSGGFKETGDDGAEREASLAASARANGVSVLGPNALGFLSSSNRLGAFGSILARPLVPGALGLVSQSGQMATQIHRQAVSRGIGMSHVVAVGNCAMVSVCDVLDFMVDDPETKVVAALLETIEPAEQFVTVARRALEAGKPLVVLKIGRNERTQRVAIAHTGVLAGHDRVIDGVLRQLGVIRVAEPEQLLEVGGLLAAKGWPKGPGTAVLTGSGGASGVISDLVDGTRVELADISAETSEALGELVAGFGVAQNPIDLTGFLADPAAYGRAAAILAADPAFDTVVAVIDPPGEASRSAERRLEAARGVDSAVGKAGKFTFVAMPVAGQTQSLAIVAVAEHGLWYSAGLGMGIYALDKAIGFAESRERLLANGSEVRDLPAIDSALLPASAKTLTEQESLRLLESVGLRAPRSALATSAGEAGELADRFGYPVVLKVQSRDVPHKTDAGGVSLNVATRAQVQAEYGAMLERVHSHQPEARIDGVLVAEQIMPVVELLVGISHDPQFGPVVTLGAGGTLTELLDDVAIRIPPLSTGDVEDMLAQLRVSRLLEGYRGAPAADTPALIEAVRVVGDLALATRDVVDELDINPLFVLPRGEGVVAGDALVVLR